jgi:hypothetical protein
MVSRIVGISAAVVGTAAVAMAIWTFVTVEGMAREAASLGSAMDMNLWKQRLQLSSSVVLVAGLVTVAGGLAQFKGRRWGLLLLAIAAAALGAFPWVLAATNQVVFPFEAPSIPETVLLGAVAVVAVIAFLAKRRNRPET